MSASVPENTALATSLASARVGRVDFVIDWSISVATMTGRRARRAMCRICRWMTGTRSGGNSTPRSPRATITPSLAATMLSRFSTASGVSILATMGVGAPHEAHADVVDAARQAEDEVGLVLLGQGRDAHRLAGQVHADVVAHPAA